MSPRIVGAIARLRPYRALVRELLDRLNAVRTGPSTEPSSVVVAVIGLTVFLTTPWSLAATGVAPPACAPTNRPAAEAPATRSI